MIVDPTLTKHPRFLLLESKVGQTALKCLLNVWGHCEFKQQGELWRSADSVYLEAIAGWTGNPGELYVALVRLQWVAELPDGGLRICKWGSYNHRQVMSWTWRERAVSSRLAHGELTVSQPLANGELTVSQRPPSPPSLSPTPPLSTSPAPQRDKGETGIPKSSRALWANLAKEKARLKAIPEEQRTPAEQAELRRINQKLRAHEAQQRET